ncbi:uncharacterized protein PV09_08845 [Verruconis gallopava]|uniref:Uncharacterized protein n=1 Tax=Verruconis gallopava TaxID=253628 RepID=A0A0D1XBI1_9PEZI|nr:uncharacterized protein PV09_08845 [Verruconis gallopava]KIV99545.1 hypothetical protein PV09_08845 [Verruconis gallopava]
MLIKGSNDTTLVNQVDVQSTTDHVVSTPPPSEPSRQCSLELDFTEEPRVRDRDGEHISCEHPMSPQPTICSRLQPSATPASTPNAFERKVADPLIDQFPAEPHGEMSSYPASPLESHSESFSLTPPATQPMNANKWSSEEIPLMQVLTLPANKADCWTFTGQPSEVACCGPLPASSSGLGIYFPDHNNSEQTQGMDYEMYSIRSEIQGSQQYSLIHQHQASPTPIRPFSADYSTAALSPALSQTIYPMGQFLEQGNLDMAYMFPPRSQQATTTFSPQMQPRPTYRPTHQRSYSIGAPISSSTPSMPLQPAYGETSFPAHLQSPSPPPRRSRAPSSKQRSKSAHLNSRKPSINIAQHSRQTGSASVDFVNFTPDDSKRILNGVAPSGSSKTKARREREAAEKRRRLSEAAKRAVLKAGGDLSDLDREVLGLEE